MIKYFLILSPIIVLLLAKILSKNEVKWHCIISMILIIIMTFSYFTFSYDVLMQKDLESIVRDNPVKYIIGQPLGATKFATFLWKEEPYFVWFQDFEASLKNETYIRGYDFNFDSKIPLKSQLKISASFNRFENKTYENYILVIEKGKEFEKLKDFNIKKCYEVLCVYEK